MRSAYLANVKDGVSQRLIKLNSSVLDNPAFRAAGWTPSPADRKQTYSPPIPTASQSEYFQGPLPPKIRRLESWPEEGEEEGGVVTGRRSNDTVGPALATKRRRRREQLEEDDSSDLSDDSDDDVETAQRAAQQINFTRMPLRGRADSSPLRNANRKDGPELLVTAASRPSTDSRYRRGSLGGVEAVKARARADTTTSSELSSENDALDPSVFARREIASRGVTSTPNLLGSNVTDRPSDPSPEAGLEIEPETESQHENFDVESVSSSLSSDFVGSLHSESLLEEAGLPGLNTSSPVLSDLRPINSYANNTASIPAPVIQDFPSSRPISMVAPVSLLGSAIRARKANPVNPVENFASLSGKGSDNPLWIKIYAPFSEDPETPYEMPLQRMSKDESSTKVVEAIGLSLWRYTEEELKPALEHNKLNVNKWTLRMVEDGEVDYDFPALSRTRPMTDFTSNNNRAARGRSRERPVDEFALVEADATQFEENQKATPQSNASVGENAESADLTKPEGSTLQIMAPPQRPVLGQPFPSALHNATLKPADVPEPQTSSATPRVGTMKTLRIRYLDMDVKTQATSMDIASDSYIAEVLEHVCKLWDLDRASYALKVSGTNTVAPLDRTLDTLGTRSDLDLVRRRFGTEGGTMGGSGAGGGPFHLMGSPGSSTSPNAPLLIDVNGPTNNKKGKKSGGSGTRMLHPLAQRQDLLLKSYTVTRKHPIAFSSQVSSSSSRHNRRMLAFDTDYLHIMPAFVESASIKTTSILFADIRNTKVSTRHPKSFRLIIVRHVGGGGGGGVGFDHVGASVGTMKIGGVGGRGGGAGGGGGSGLVSGVTGIGGENSTSTGATETKRYDFEAKDVAEAAEIVTEIKKVMVPF